MREKYKISAIPRRDLKTSFLIDFEVWLATKKGCAPNTIYKFMQFLRIPLLKAQRERIIFPDPYNGYKMKMEHVDRGYLKEEDVLAIAPLADYSVINCFLDNDAARRAMLKRLRRESGDTVTDKSVLYPDYKNLNDYLVATQPQITNKL